MLSAIHPEFYPYPVRIEVNNEKNHITLHDVKGTYLSKAELPKLYVRCSEFLHRGTERKLVSSRSPEQLIIVPKKYFAEIANWTNKIVRLLNQHRISSLDRSRHLIVALKNNNDAGRVMVGVASGPPARPS